MARNSSMGGLCRTLTLSRLAPLLQWDSRTHGSTRGPPEDPRAPVRRPLRDPRRAGPPRPRTGGRRPPSDQAQHRQPGRVRLPRARAPAARDRRAHRRHRSVHAPAGPARRARGSEEHTSELQSLMRISYAVFCLKKKKDNLTNRNKDQHEQQQYTESIYHYKELTTNISRQKS